jgi:hypothetical protein
MPAHLQADSHHTGWKLHKLNVTINIVDFWFLCGLWVVVVTKEATINFVGLLIKVGSFWLASGSRASSSWLVIRPS